MNGLQHFVLQGIRKYQLRCVLTVYLNNTVQNATLFLYALPEAVYVQVWVLS